MRSFHTDCKADGHMSDATGTAHAFVRLYVAKASLAEQTQHTHFLSRGIWCLRRPGRDDFNEIENSFVIPFPELLVRFDI